MDCKLNAFVVLFGYNSEASYKESLIALAPLPLEDDLISKQRKAYLNEILQIYGKHFPTSLQSSATTVLWTRNGHSYE